MSKKKRRRSGPEREPAAAPPADKSSARRRWLLPVGGLVFVLAAGFIARAILQSGPGGGGLSLPEPLPQVRDTSLSYEDFVGSDECEECHKPEYDAWKASTHGNAGGLPGEVRIIAPFDGVPIRFRDAVVTPLTTQDGRFVFRVQQQGRPEGVFEVAGVVGGGHMVGGGTQAFFAEFPDGTVRFLPFDFIKQEGVWFCQTAGRSDQGWAPITPEMALADCNDWPPWRLLGSFEDVANCQQCHGSQIMLGYNAEAKRYETRFTTLAINCESCHGPGRRHIEIADSDSIGLVTDIAAEALATRDKDGSLEVCFQCHAVKAQLEPGFFSGKPLQEYFSDLALLLSYRPYFPDGRIRVFAYQQQHLYSDCYLNGSMTCVDCHDPHSQQYRDIWGEPLVGRFSDGQCLDCHPSKAEEAMIASASYRDSLWAIDHVESLRRAAPAETEVRVNSHAFHPVGTPGSRCIDCHMPYLQEPDVGVHLRYSRSDHTIPVPRPGLDAFFGIENACVKCHGGRSVEEVQAKVREWYGELKPPKSLIRGLIEARGVRDRLEAARLMLAPEEDYVALQFTNLSYYLLTYLTPNMPSLEDEVVEHVSRFVESEDPDLRALALASLHLARGEEPSVRSFLAKQLRELGASDSAIRRRWVWMLGFLGDSYTARNDHRAALVVFRKAAEILPDDAEVLLKLGNASSSLGNYGDAVGYFRRSLASDPEQPHALANLAVALAMQGDFDGSTAVFGQAIEMNPYEPRTYFSLGNTLLRGRNVDGAIEAFQQALALSPGMAEAHFALAGIFYRQTSYDLAIVALERGLEYDRANAGAQELLSTLRGRDQ
jgi:Flp pilus assembly protein TadD